jgi:3-mercaptopyruvate sulfurtransferase SseA
MHVHELNPWRTLIALSVFIIILIVGFVTMREPLLTYKLDMKQSVSELNKANANFYPWQLDSFLQNKMQNVVLFDIRDNFVYGQGHIPGAENLSAQDLTKEESIKRLEDLKDKNITVVLYGKDQLQANGPWMLFRQVGFDNVKVLVGGYQYYSQHKNELAASKSDSTFQKEVPRYDFAEMAAPKDGSVISATTEKKPVEVRRRKKTAVVAGGC